VYPFDQNNQQMYQQYANHADQGTYSQIPEQEARQNISKRWLPVVAEVSDTESFTFVLDQAALQLVVAHDGREDGQAGGVGGGPAVGAELVALEVEGRRARCHPAVVGLAGLVELVEHAVDRIDDEGVAAQTVSVIDRGVLTVSAKRDEETADSDRPFVRERVTGTLRRRVYLGDAYDADKVEAAYENGVLTVRVPVAEQAKARKVEISSDASKMIAA